MSSITLENQGKLEDQERKISLRESIEKYVRYWPWFALCALLAIFIAYVKLRYSTKIYESNATILVQNPEEDKVLKGLESFGGSPLFSEKISLENEMSLFKTAAILNEVVKNLKLNLTYKMVGRNAGLKSTELYTNSPIEVKSILHDSILYESAASFTLHVKSYGRFELSYLSGNEIGSFNFGQPVSTTIGTLIFNKSLAFSKNSIDQEFTIEVLPVEVTASNLTSLIEISRADKISDIINIRVQGPNIIKNNEIINELIQIQKAYKITDQNAISSKTTGFINERLSYLSDELGDVEKDVEQFKTQNELVDVQTESEVYIDGRNENESKLTENIVQIKLVNLLQDYLLRHKGFDDVLPANLGFEDGAIVAVTNQYNKLVLERQKLLKNSKATNPSLIRIEDQLLGLRTTMEEALKANETKCKMAGNVIRENIKSYRNKIAKVPSIEREYREIEREQKIKEALYIYLLQRREENEIASAGSIGNTQIIQSASSNGIPIAPNSKKTYVVALIFGLLVPFGIFYVIFLLDTKVHDAKELEQLIMQTVL